MEDDADFTHDPAQLVELDDQENPQHNIQDKGDLGTSSSELDDEENHKHNIHDKGDLPRDSRLRHLPQEAKLERAHRLTEDWVIPPTRLWQERCDMAPTDEMVKLATDLVCPSCHLSKPPKKLFLSRPEVRSVVFNTVVHADLKYMHDFKVAVYVGISCLTRRPMRNRRPEHVAAKFMSMWIGLFGPPLSIRLDQGGEW